MTYDVALCFTGENREYIEAVADQLTNLDFRVILQPFDAADLENLPEHLEIIENQSRYTVVFVSKDYLENFDPRSEIILSRHAENQRLIITRFDESLTMPFKTDLSFILKNLSPPNFAQTITPILKAYLFDNTNPETFISKIRINKSGNISYLTIRLSEEKRTHLIITGKNGSGKTSLFNDLRYFFQVVMQNGYGNFINEVENLLKNTSARNALEPLLGADGSVPVEVSNRLKELDDLIKRYEKGLQHFGGNEVYFTNPKEIKNKIRYGDLVIKYFRADRRPVFEAPEGIEKVKINQTDKIDEPVNTHFIQYLVNLKAERSFAKDDGDTADVERIDAWFARFENMLREIFDAPDLQLQFDRKKFNFEIVTEGRLPSALDKLPDGYTAVMDFISEIQMRAKTPDVAWEDLEGVVLIDEIEKHLDVDLQQKIFPFLTKVFPKIQFIIATHSPFVLTSVSNAVVCYLDQKSVIDLEIKSELKS